MWPSVDLRFGVGRSGGCADLQAIATAWALRVHVVAHASGWRGSGSAASRIRRGPGGGQISEATPLAGAPLRSAARVVRGRGLGRGLAGPAKPPAVDDGRKFLPAEGSTPPGARPVGRSGLSDVMAAVMNLGRQPTVAPPGLLSRGGGTCWIGS